MDAIEPTETPPDPSPDITEGAQDMFLDLLLTHWPRIAATAWDGFLAHGRGAVTIENGSVPPLLSYHPGTPCPCHADLVAAYDPDIHAVVAVVEQGRKELKVGWIYALSGVPGPREAVAHVTAAECRAIVH